MRNLHQCVGDVVDRWRLIVTYGCPSRFGRGMPNMNGNLTLDTPSLDGKCHACTWRRMHPRRWRCEL